MLILIVCTWEFQYFRPDIAQTRKVWVAKIWRKRKCTVCVLFFFFVSSFICFISFLFILSISLSRSLSIFPEYIRKSLCALCCSVLCCLAVAHTPTTHFHIEKCFFPNRMQTTNRKKVNRIHWNIHEHNNQNIIELKEQKTRLLYIFWQQVH